MRKIALTLRVDPIESYNEKRDAVDQKLTDLLYSCGFIPLMVPNNPQYVDLFLKELKPDGVVLSGGNDLVKYGGKSLERDTVEKALLNFAIEKNLPLLGICRGMQFIQDYFGVPLRKIENHVRTHHDLEINGKVYRANSYHTFGTDASASDLKILARAEDGIVEAIQHKDLPIMGIMWHPERNSPVSFTDKELIAKHLTER